MAALPGRRVAVRDSRWPDGPALLFTQAAWESFLHRLREGVPELVNRHQSQRRRAVHRPGRAGHWPAIRFP